MAERGKFGWQAPVLILFLIIGVLVWTLLVPQESTPPPVRATPDSSMIVPDTGMIDTGDTNQRDTLANLPE